MKYAPLVDYRFPNQDDRDEFQAMTPEQRVEWIRSLGGAGFAWHVMFPEAKLTTGQAGLIDAEVKPDDYDIWAETILDYMATYKPWETEKVYHPSKVINVKGVFRRKKQEKERQNNGANRQLNNGIGAKGQIAIDGFNERRRIEAELRAIRPRNEADSR